MGKGEEEQSIPGTSLDAQGTTHNAEDNRCRGCCRFKGLVSFKCVFVLMLGMGVLVSAVFLLPFFKNGDLGDLNLDNKYKGTIFIAYLLEKSSVKVPFLWLTDLNKFKVVIFLRFGCLNGNIKVPFLLLTDQKQYVKVPFLWLTDLKKLKGSLGVTGKVTAMSPGGHGFKPWKQPLAEMQGHDIVASFMLEKPVSFVRDNILQLADDIFDEISVSNTKVDIISLENITGSNITEVVFAVDSEVKNTRVSLTALSLVRSELETVITGQSALHLTAPLFGNPFSFDVLKFRGGITVSPKQSGFPMQQVQILFNFTLNFSIDEIQDNFHELKSQLKSGLHLSSYENLYMSLTSRRGSTVDPPTIVQCKVLLAVGINPSSSRLKQLAHTIGFNSGNLGLNNTVFGRVKQVSLSSFLPHSRGSNSGSPSPSPAPLPHPHPHPHHHHHHHNRDSTLAPAISPAPKVEKGGSISRKVSPVSAPVFAPAPVHHKTCGAQPPCHFGRFPKKANRHHPYMVPARAPVPAPHITPSPHQQIHAQPPTPHVITASSPLPNVVYAHHVQPPPKSNSVAEPPDRFTSCE
ncbi:hypothetical protein RND71_036287 [Anisodus tanguticus]|uniref:DUF7036 domain-containing protein n=1 Tax=Anisodus tanguticus TaxID=243964 RepID=A0AAE1R6G3_9SOLA|nr:hypothetical protein RND71_036287 [Anisodus tanguticus]